MNDSCNSYRYNIIISQLFIIILLSTCRSNSVQRILVSSGTHAQQEYSQLVQGILSGLT